MVEAQNLRICSGLGGVKFTSTIGPGKSWNVTYQRNGSDGRRQSITNRTPSQGCVHMRISCITRVLSWFYRGRRRGWTSIPRSKHLANSAARSSAKAYIYHSLTAYCAACAGTAVAGGLTARRRIEDCRCALVGPDRDGPRMRVR